MNAETGILFDMDGLLIDSQPIWRRAEKRMLAAMGHEFTEELSVAYRGMNAYDVAATAYRILAPAGPVEGYQKMMREGLVESFEQGPILEMPGAAGLVRRLRGLAPMAVASGSPLMGIERSMEALGIRECFDRILSSESVARGKPAPDAFLKAAELLGVPPRRCVVFEDSLVGVQAGLAAGMSVFAVPSMAPAEIARLATRVYGSLADVGVADVAAALGL